MDYGYLLRRAWDIVWSNKWLIVLGIIVALTGSGSLGSGSGSGYSFGGNAEREFDRGFQEPFGGMEEFGEEFDFQGDGGPGLPLLGGLALVVLIPLIILGTIVGIILWALGVIARGALVAGSDILDAGGATSFGAAWREGWERKWRLIGVGILPAIPAVLLLFIGASLGGALYGFNIIQGDPFAGPAGGLTITFVALVVLAALAALVLGLLRTFAERAVMLEDAAVFESYGRGWEVLSQNLGPAIVIFLIQIAIGIALGFLALVASPLLICLCLIAIPLMLAVNGTVSAYFSTLWTLAWRRWTGRASAEPVVVEAPPAV